VSAYVDAPRYMGRPWLEQKVTGLLAQNDCHFLLLTAEPGAGKSAFMAGMARHHPSWPRYFIRRDQLSPFGNIGVRDFLLSVGLQMAAYFPAAFQLQPLRVVIEQRLGDLEPGAEAVGAQVERLLASPFYQAVLEVHQQVQSAGGKLIGLRVGEWFSDPHLIPLSDLQAMALIDPGKVLLGQQPDLRLVVLVDALDELRYHPEGAQFLSWLESLPMLPANLSFLLTSRDDPALLSELRNRLGQNLIELSLSSQTSQVQEELRRYATSLAQEPSLAALLANESLQQAFIERAVERSNGNLGFLDALGRALDSALAQADDAGALRLMSLQSVPAGLNALHAHLLRQVWEAVRRERVEMRDLESGETFYLNAWTALYMKILGVLAVALEPLTPDQVRSLGGISALSDELPSALQRLTQFCDLVGNRYRLYHASLAEFITAESTRQNPTTLDLYVDANAWHTRIASFYWPSGDHADEARLDAYGLNHLAFHLSQVGDLRLLQLPNIAWMHRRFDAGGHTYAGFLADLDLGLRVPLAGSSGNSGWQDWPMVARLGLLRASLVSLSFQLPPEIMLRALQLGLWTGERVLDEAARLPLVSQRQRLFQLLLDSGLLDGAQQERARLAQQAAALLQASPPPETSAMDPGIARPQLVGHLDSVHRALEAILKVARRDVIDVSDWKLWQALYDTLKEACQRLQQDDSWTSLETLLGLRPSFQAINPLRERHRLLALAYQWAFDAYLADKYLDTAIELAVRQPSPQRELALQALAPFADGPAVSRLLQQALQADSGPLQQDLLASLAARLSADQLAIILQSMRQIRGDEADQLHALTALLPHLVDHSSIYPDAMEWALDCARRLPQDIEAGSDGSPSQALLALLPGLKEEQRPAILQEAFQAAGQLLVGANATRLTKALTLAAFLPLLPPVQCAGAVHQALSLVDPEKVDEPLFLSPVVAVLAPYLEPELLAGYLEWMPLANSDLRQLVLEPWIAHRQFDPVVLGRVAMSAVALIRWDSSSRVLAFTMLLPQIPDSLLGEALEFALDVREEAVRLQALLAITPRLEHHLASQLLDVARLMPALSRIRLLAGLASRLDEPLRQQVLDESLQGALSLADPDQQALSLNFLVAGNPDWIFERRESILPFLSPMLNPAGDRERGAYLRRLSYLVPLWSSCLPESGVERLYKVLDEVCHHWQWE
jgi:hypothetical protein